MRIPLRSLWTLASLVLCALALAPAVFADTTKILGRDAVWKFDDRGQDLGAAWKAADFADAAWKSGKAPLGFGDDVSETDPNLPIGTVIGFGPDPANKIMNTYFRTNFEVADPTAFSSLTIYVHVDDGAVVYLNGTELFRRGIKEGEAVTFATPAKFKPKEETFTLPASVLKKGRNVLAAEVHQDGGDSSDLWFEMGIDGVKPAQTTVLDRAAVWKYDDRGRDLAADWKTPGFADGAWKSGKAPLGFGDDVSETDPGLPIGTVIGFGPDPANKIMTTYLRTEITVGDLTGMDTLQVYVHVDDGAVVYLNGTELFRRGIKDGEAVTFATPAKFKPKEETFTLPASVLKKGRNVLAAEVHQDGGDSSDLWFELGLVALSSGAPAPKAAATTPLVPDPKAPLGTVTKAVATVFGDSRTEMGFAWYTTAASDKSDIQVVASAPAKADFAKAKAFTGTWSLAPNSPQQVLHKGTVSGLTAGTSYSYRVGDASRNLWSEVGTFKTAPAKAEAFTFIDLADPQAKSEEEAIVAARTFVLATATVKDAAFLAINGDLVDVGMMENQWDWLFGHAAPALRALPFVPVAGNHDEDKGSFIDHFTLKTPAGAPTVSGAYYSFDWSNAHVIVLNTNEDSPEYADLTPAQVAWFMDDAQAAKKAGARWILLFLHKGPYTTSNHATDGDILGENGVRTKFALLLDDLGVDLVFQGHDHIYARTWPLKDGKVDQKADEAVNPKGPIYVIPATAGPKTYYKNKKIDPAFYTLFAKADENHAAKYGPEPSDNSRPLRSAVQNFLSVTIDGNTLKTVVYEVDDQVNGGNPFVVDQFGISKK